MKFFSALTFLVALATLQTAQASLVCSDAHGKYSYSLTSHEGGAAPFVGMIVRQETWGYDSTILGQSTTKYLQGTTEMPLVVTEVGSSDVISSESTHASSREIYVQKFDLKRKDGGLLSPKLGAKEVSIYLLCEKFHSNIPIP